MGRGGVEPSVLRITGATAIAARDDGRELLLSIPFGLGAALTLDEAALLVNRDNPYWGSEEFAIAQGVAGALAAAALAAHMHARAAVSEPDPGERLRAGEQPAAPA